MYIGLLYMYGNFHINPLSTRDNHNNPPHVRVISQVRDGSIFANLNKMLAKMNVTVYKFLIQSC